MAQQKEKYTKWVACWGNATSITDRKECVYAKDITLRYPVRVVFSGSRLRFRFSNLTGTEDVTMTKAYVVKQDEAYVPVPVTFGGNASVVIKPGKEVESDEIDFDIEAGQTVEVSMYFGGYTQMNAGTLITGPLSKGKYSYGDFASEKELPIDLTRNTNWFLFPQYNRCADRRKESCPRLLWRFYHSAKLARLACYPSMGEWFP